MSSQGVLDNSGDGSGLVTGDAVVVDLRLAKLPSRGLAFLLDLVLQVGAFVLLALFVAFANIGDAVLTLVVVFVSSVAILVGYPATMETLSRGRTVGKLALGLRAVRSDGGAIRFRHALVRALVAVVEIYLCSGAIAVITSLLSPEGKRVGDYMAGTVVVRERAPKPSTTPLWVPTSLQPWAATLDLSRLQAATALSARQYLARASLLNAQARASIGGSLANEVASQVYPPPPAGVSAELFLGVVLAERARRAQASEMAAAGWAAASGPPTPPELNVPPALSRPEGPDATGGFAAPS